MGIDLQDTYGKNLRAATQNMNHNEWHKHRDLMLAEICEICPYDIIYNTKTRWTTARQRFRSNGGEKSEANIWCEENLNGRFFGLMEKEIEPDRREWILCFEFEEDALAFKLRWL